ncbi:MAG: hypothetical protein KF795_26695 [Labilithrix sp.]|nr:hypothetical protein [Labilithrix sp.]
MSRLHGLAIVGPLLAVSLVYACGGDDGVGAPIPEGDAGRDGAPGETDDGSTPGDGGGDAGSGTRSTVAVGDGFACVLGKDRRVSCWGRNDVGQLGRDPASTASCGTFPCSAVPEAVAGLANVTRLVAGSDFACALDQARALWCWGSNAKGQLARADLAPSFTPRKAIVDVVDVSAAGAHACALGSDGFVRCWGENTCEIFGKTDDAVQTIPRQVQGVPQMAQISVGPDAICGTKPDGLVLCWGADHRGSLGHDVDPSAPLCGAVPFDPVAKHVQAESNELPIDRIAEVHIGAGVGCARRTDGVVLCWGDNEHGGLGQGLPESTPHPRALEVPALKASALDLHGGTPCAIVGDRLLCWGASPYGQLDTLGPDAGCGGAGCRPLAHPISGMMPVRHVWSGHGAIGAIKDDATLWMWGQNDSAELALPASDPANEACATGSVCVPRPRQVTNAPALD